MPDIYARLSYSAISNSVSFRYFKTSPEIIQLAVMLYVRFPLSLKNVEDLLHERGVDVSYESVRYWWHRFGSQFANQIKKRRAGGIHSCRLIGKATDACEQINFKSEAARKNCFICIPSNENHKTSRLALSLG